MAGVIGLLFTIIILGVVLYLVDVYLPMPAPIKLLVRVVVVLIIIWILLRAAGLVPL